MLTNLLATNFVEMSKLLLKGSKVEFNYQINSCSSYRLVTFYEHGIRVSVLSRCLQLLRSIFCVNANAVKLQNSIACVNLLHHTVQCN